MALALSTYAVDSFKVKIKNVTRIHGMETYTLSGFGLVTGLNGTGDSDKELTQHTLNNLLKTMKIDINEEEIKANNIAAVMISARIDNNAASGDMIDINISTVGDATSLLGGKLEISPVYGPDTKMWGVASGSVQLGGFSFGDGDSGGDQAIKNVTTHGVVVNGMKMLQTIGSDVNAMQSLTLHLRNPDFHSANAMTEVINNKFFATAITVNDKTVVAKIPGDYRKNNQVAKFINEVQQLEFNADRRAEIVFTERTGTIVISGEVRKYLCCK